MVAAKTIIHYGAITLTVALGLVLLFAFASLSGIYAPQSGALNQTVSVGSTGSSNAPAQATLRTTSAFGSNYVSNVALHTLLNVTSYGYGKTSQMASNALESQIASLGAIIQGTGYAGPIYWFNITSYNITKHGSSFVASSNISVTILKPSNASHVISFIDAIPNTLVTTVSPQLAIGNLTALRLRAARNAASNASSQVSFFIGSMPLYSENIIITGIGTPVSAVAAANQGNQAAITSTLGTPVRVKGTARVDAAYATAPIKNVAIGNSITVQQYGSFALLAPSRLLFVTINESGTTPQLATNSLNVSLEALSDALLPFVNNNASLLSTSNYRVRFYLSGTGPQFYALENIVATVPNQNNVSLAIGSIPTVPGAYVTGVGSGYTESQAAVVQQEITNLISNSTSIAKYVAGQNRTIYLTSVTIQQPKQAPQVYLNSTTSPGGISVNSRIYNQSIFLNSTVSSTFEYSSPISSNLKLTTVGIASGIPAEANISVRIEGNGTTALLAANSLLSTLSQFNSTVSKYINSNFSLVTVPKYTISYNNSRYSAYVNVHLLVPNIANATAVQQVLGILPNATVTGVTPQLSTSQITSLEAQALATAIAQAKSQISVVLGGASSTPQITVTAQNFSISNKPTVVSTSVSSQPVVVPTITQGLNGTQSVVATINLTATVSPAAIR